MPKPFAPLEATLECRPGEAHAHVVPTGQGYPPRTLCHQVMQRLPDGVTFIAFPGEEMLCPACKTVLVRDHAASVSFPRWLPTREPQRPISLGEPQRRQEGPDARR